MQNIPGIPLEKEEQIAVLKISAVKKSDQQGLFADLFNQHADMVESELALAPVSTKDKMVEAAPVAAAGTAAATSSPATAGKSAASSSSGKTAAGEEKAVPARDSEARISEEEFEDVKEDLKAYGMTDEEIGKLEEQVKSDEGMTWGQLVAAIAEKMTAMRSTRITDDQKVELKSFFSKFGFTDKESDKLVTQLEKGNFDKVLKELKAKVDAMPQDKQLLFDKKEIEAFSAALGFSKEFTDKVKELLGSNALPKEVKQAFTLIRQELADMDTKNRELVKAVGKAFAKAMGDESKATTAARQIAEAVDLKPRVAEEKVRAEVKEDLAQAVKVRKDSLPENTARKADRESLAANTGIKAETGPETTADKPDNEAESEGNWNHMFNNLRDDGAQGGNAEARTERAAAAALSKAGVTELASQAKTKSAWEKVSAPKVMKQVNNAVLKTLSSGAKQLTLQLTPENLGKLSIVLQVNGKEVGATIRAENADAAKIITENLDIIKHSLESQGLKVEKLDVQAGLAGNQDYRDWYGESEHNLAREREVMIAMRNHMKQMRDENNDILAQDVQHAREQAIHADQGLHIIA
ncbi:MAG: flagellar hook-length control protein FliK [Desulfovibrionaceae bacterium]|nr:flagellar hook-length control protein FliK [Desulfovibrionaceae bacterium]